MVDDNELRAEGADPYRELFEHSADAILIIEGETFVECNQATVEMLRYRDRDQLLRTHPSELSPPTQPDGRDSFEKANEMIAIAFEKGSHRFEWDHQRADGEVFPVEVLLTAVQARGRRILHVVWRDITERKRLESQLRHAQKMEAIGKLAGGIAHDFNNLLVAILGHADLLGHQYRLEPEVRDHLQQIRSAGERAAGLVRQLLAFSRKQELQPRVFDLNGLLQDLEQLLKRLIGEDVRLVTTASADPLLILADPGQIEQIVINLATNARDAMPTGGALTFELRRVTVSEASIGATAPIEPGPYALLSVSDTGTGMDEATLRRAFDPFFTTKEPGKGTGLGLATVFGIVAQTGGSIGIVSTPGRGTTVRIHLPLVASGQPRDLPLDVSGQPRDLHLDVTTSAGKVGSETILVAEDEEAVSSLVADVLESKGYRVLLASDGAEALETWRRYREEIDLLVTDLVMPNLSGVELVRELRERGFRRPVLFASGYTNRALGRLAELGEQIDLLEKPFTPGVLIARVRRALDNG